MRLLLLFFVINVFIYADYCQKKENKNYYICYSDNNKFLYNCYTYLKINNRLICYNKNKEPYFEHQAKKLDNNYNTNDIDEFEDNTKNKYSYKPAYNNTNTDTYYKRNIKKKTNQQKCGLKRTCGQMNSCEEAYFYLNKCGVSRLDRDKDGIPCEKLCK